MKNQNNAIEVDKITKSFKVYYDKGSQLKERLLFWNRNRYEEHQVLKGISFEVKKGEAIGLIGHNGCGKSTTLKLLSRIIYPDSGSIQMNGRVSSLIELGAGFHPDMSGRENIYTNAAIFGLTKKEIDARLDDIIAFSELEEFIDNPVRTYSSGMYMRLAFSVAINVDADILLIDEILAVGDANFQAKCFNRLREIKANGTTIVIVSHSLGQIEQICERSIWIHEGEIRMEGVPREVHAEYLGFMGEMREKQAEKERLRQESKGQSQGNREASEKQEAQDASGTDSAEKDNQANQDTAKQTEDLGNASQDENQTNIATDETQHTTSEAASTEGAKEETPKKEKRWGNGNAKITRVSMRKANGKESALFCTGEDVDLVIEYKVNKPVKDAVFGIAVYNSQGLHCYGTNTKIDQLEEFDLTKDGTLVVHLERLNLLPEVYSLDIAIECEVGLPVDYYTKAYKFEMYSIYGEVGHVRIDHKWDFGQEDASK